MRSDDAILVDMLVYAERAAAALERTTWDHFRVDLDLQDATIRRLLIVGEAAGKVGDERRADLPAIDWHALRGMRNRLVHEYGDVDLTLIWNAAREDAPLLATQLRVVLGDHPDTRAETGGTELKWIRDEAGPYFHPGDID